VNEAYVRTVRLLLDVLPAVFTNPDFAMKGGTALNLFVQDMPRLSVDIDVVFTPHDASRDVALAAIGVELVAVADRARRMGHRVLAPKTSEGHEAKLFIQAEGVEVKVEVNHVFRGTVLPTVTRTLVPAARQRFSASVDVPVLSSAELYGSKLVAALDRQHPRDLFDVKLMLETGYRWDEATLDCFVVYLAGHNRPMHEVLFPNLKPMAAIFENEFEGMTVRPVEVAELEQARENIVHGLPNALLPRQRDFLLSMARAAPDWTLLPYAHLDRLPALQWKLLNLQKLRRSARRFADQHDELAARLGALRGSGHPPGGH
jgi:predicted nucleotidyltransferase component of viral defense system